MADIISNGNRFDSYKVCANEAITFKLIRSLDDIENDSIGFKPEMSHQIFGDSEMIFGYKDLEISYYCSAANMVPYLSIKYTSKINPKFTDGVNADDILKLLMEKLQVKFLTSLDAFASVLSNEKDFKPHGNLIHSFSSISDRNVKQNYEIYEVTQVTDSFRVYHERIQPFLLFYIDAASYIDIDDPRWNYYFLYEKYSSSHGRTMYAFIGYITVYNYYAYPDKIRPRISQVLIMPPFQSKGHGAIFLQTFYKRCWGKKEILDLAVEDPSENFQRLRDFLDCKNCISLPSFQEDKLRCGFSEHMVQEARDKLKLSKKQTRRIYEITRLKCTNCFDSVQFKAYRNDIKKRLNIPFLKNSRHMEKLSQALDPQELSTALNIVSEEQRLDSLEKQFQSCVNEYRIILNRLELNH